MNYLIYAKNMVVHTKLLDIYLADQTPKMFSNQNEPNKQASN